MHVTEKMLETDLFRVSFQHNIMSFEISSRLEMVDRLWKPGRDYFRNYLESFEVEALCAVLKEILDNAVVHGNRLDVSKRVSGTIQFLGEDKVDVSIEVDGEGFENSEFSLDSLTEWKFSNGQDVIRIKMEITRVPSNDPGVRTTASLRIVKQ